MKILNPPSGAEPIRFCQPSFFLSISSVCHLIFSIPFQTTLLYLWFRIPPRLTTPMACHRKLIWHNPHYDNLTACWSLLYVRYRFVLLIHFLLHTPSTLASFPYGAEPAILLDIDIPEPLSCSAKRYSLFFSSSSAMSNNSLAIWIANCQIFKSWNLNFTIAYALCATFLFALFALRLALCPVLHTLCAMHHAFCRLGLILSK